LSIIEANRLTRRFGAAVAVEDVTFNLSMPEVLGFLGPNGAGKTTTIRMLSGLIAPTSGEATVAGIRTDREPEALHEVIGVLTESPGFYERLSARRNLEYFAAFYSGLDVAAQMDKYLKLMGLWERRESRVGTYSKGMKQRLALVRALLHEPRILFLDEPTSGLDPEAAGEVRRLISNLGAEGRTIILSTHNLTEAEQLCSRIAVIQKRLIALDTPQALRRRFFRRHIVVRLEAADTAVTDAVRHLPFVANVETAGTELILDMADPDRNRPELVKTVVETGGRVLEVKEAGHSLEEVYLRLMHDEVRPQLAMIPG